MESLRDNAGWQAWNMSNRISEANNYARDARRLLEGLESDGAAPESIGERRRLLVEMEDAASRANATWERMKTAMAQGDPTLAG